MNFRKLWLLVLVITLISALVIGCSGGSKSKKDPQPEPTPTPTPTATVDPDVTPTPTATPDPDVTPTPTATPDPTATPTPTPVTPTPTPTPETPDMTENFDSMTAGSALSGSDWAIGSSVDGSTITATISNERSASAPNSLKLYDNNSTTGAAEVDLLFDSSKSKGEFSAKFYVVSGSKFYITLGKDNKSSGRFADFTFSNSGKIQVRPEGNPAGSATSIGDYTQDAWHTIEVSWDTTDGTNGTYTISVDGSTVGLGVYGGGSNANVPAMLIFKAGDTAAVNTTAFVDDISVTFN